MELSKVPLAISLLFYLLSQLTNQEGGGARHASRSREALVRDTVELCSSHDLNLVFNQRKQRLFSAFREISFILMSQLGEEMVAGEAECLSCIFSSFLKLKWTLEVGSVIKLQPCLAAPLVMV